MPRSLRDMDAMERQAAGDVALQRGGPLRPAWLDERFTGAGRLALSPLPGLTMYQRTLSADLATLQGLSVDHIVCLLEDHEFSKWGVPDLVSSYEAAGFVVQRFPIRDHSVCTLLAMREIVNCLSDMLAGGAAVLVHCVGGLGRSGIVAACYLVAAGLPVDESIAVVRHTRSSYAIETLEQEEFVRLFTNERMSQGLAAGGRDASNIPRRSA